jgi:hypothetical protein
MHDASHTKRFSIHPQKHQKALNYLDKWGQNHDNVSDKICRGIEKVGDEEEKGTKLDSFTEAQNKIETGNKKIENFVIMIQQYTPEKLAEEYDERQLKWLNLYTTNLKHKIELAIDSFIPTEKEIRN